MASLVPKEGGHTLLHNTLLVISPWSRKPPFFVCSQKSLHQGSFMQHMINKAHTRWVAANLINRDLAHASNHKHGTAGHSQGRSSTPQAADVLNPIEGGSYYIHRNWRSTGVLNLSWHTLSRPSYSTQ